MKKLFILFMLSISCLQATYKIVEAAGRTFLLNEETGKSYRYTFDDVEKQGWQPTTIELGDFYLYEPLGRLYEKEK